MPFGPSGPIPDSHNEMVAMLVQAGITRAYCDLRRAAKQGRLTESEIDDIERVVLVEIGKVRAAEPEFPGFSVAMAARDVESMLREFFDAAKQAGRKKRD